MTLSAASPVYSVVVPIYESGPELGDVVARLVTVFEEEVQEPYEILLVDDGSESEDTRVLSAELACMPNVALFRLTRNFGKPGAVMCGLARSRGAWIVTIDDDLQQLPEDIPKLIARRDHDVVTATHERKAFSIGKRLTGRVKSAFDKGVLGYAEPLSAMKLLQRHVVDSMLVVATNRPFIPALIRMVTDDVVAVKTVHQPSAYPASRYTFRTRWRQFSNLFFGNSIFTMLAFTWLGLALVVLGGASAVAAAALELLGNGPGALWNPAAAAVFFVGGLNLMAIGLGGQYFIRILDVSTNKPPYIVREAVGVCDAHERTSGAGETDG